MIRSLYRSRALFVVQFPRARVTFDRGKCLFTRMVKVPEAGRRLRCTRLAV